MKNKIFFAFQMAVLALWSTFARADSAQITVESLLVLPLKVQGDLDPKFITTLNEVLVSELQAASPKGVRILGISDLDAMIEQDRAREAADCDDSSCLVEIGKAMGSSHLLQINLGQIADQYAINVKLIASDKPVVLFRKVLYVSSSNHAILKGLRVVVSDLGQHLVVAEKDQPLSAKIKAPKKNVSTAQPVSAKTKAPKKNVSTDQPVSAKTKAPKKNVTAAQPGLQAGKAKTEKRRKKRRTQDSGQRPKMWPGLVMAGLGGVMMFAGLAGTAFCYLAVITTDVREKATIHDLSAAGLLSIGLAVLGVPIMLGGGIWGLTNSIRSVAGGEE